MDKDNAGKTISVLFLLGMLGCSNTGLDRGPEVDTNGALRLFVIIETADPADLWPGTVATVGVHSVSTGAAVSGADVRVGHGGSLVALPEGMPPYLGGYQAMLPAFAEDWDISVVRGADHVRGLHLVGSSDPSVSLVDDDGGIYVHWAPAHQEGVSSHIDVTRLQPPPSPYDGPLALSASSPLDEGSAGPFSVPRSSGDLYDIALTLSREYDEAWGTASVRVKRRTTLQDP